MSPPATLYWSTHSALSLSLSVSVQSRPNYVAPGRNSQSPHTIAQPNPIGGSSSSSSGIEGACKSFAPPALYRAFLETQVVNPFRSLTRDLMDLYALATFLWPTYVGPLEGRKETAPAVSIILANLDWFASKVAGSFVCELVDNKHWYSGGYA